MAHASACQHITEQGVPIGMARAILYVLVAARDQDQTHAVIVEVILHMSMVLADVIKDGQDLAAMNSQVHVRMLVSTAIAQMVAA